jgi:hypothetical protein
MASRSEVLRLIDFLAADPDLFCWEDGESGVVVEIHDLNGPHDVASRHYAALTDGNGEEWSVYDRKTTREICRVRRTLVDDDEEVVLKLLALEKEKV